MSEINYRNIVFSGATPATYHPVGHIDMSGFNALSVQGDVISVSGTPTSLNITLIEAGTPGMGAETGTLPLSTAPTAGQAEVLLFAPPSDYLGKRYVQLKLTLAAGSGSPSIHCDLIVAPINV
ncbi:MAG: hypothetical protein R3F30_02055 [Planctomycetota bacterium]